MNVADVHKVMSKNHVFYYDDYSENKYTLDCMLDDNENNIPENALLKKDLRNILADTIKALPERDRVIITLYYYEELMFKEIAEMLHVSESRISQIHSRVLIKMRMSLEIALQEA
jgi:RNA polymerase sigma factor for flagellar operon FliA